LPSRAFKIGDSVCCDSGHTTVEGKIVRIATESGSIGDFVYSASDEHPRYIVKTENGMHIAESAQALSRLATVGEADPPQPEQLILVDSEDRELGVGEKLQVHREGALHRAFSVFVFDHKKRLLLQKRAQTKYHSAGLWSNTACGHPRPGEATLAAAHRRLREEMGFDCELRRVFGFVYREEMGNGLIEHEYDHVFVGEFNGTPVPDSTEVEEWYWIDFEHLKLALSEKPEEYSCWLHVAITHRELQD